MGALAVVMGVAAGAGRAAGEAGDGAWPRWGGGADRNMVAPGVTLPESFDPGIRGSKRADPDLSASRHVRWITRLGPRTYGSPVVAWGRVLIGTTTGGLAHTWGPAPQGVGKSGGDLVCLEAATGRGLWHLPLPKLSSRVAHHADTGYGMCATATIEGDRAYMVSNRGEVLCLDLGGMADGNDGPFRDEAALLAPTDDRGETAPPAALPPDCGDVLWSYDMVRETGAHPHDASSSSVLVHGELLYVSTGNGRNEREDQVPSPEAPSLIVLAKGTGRLVAWDAEGIGTRMWKSQWSSPSLSVAEGTERIVFGAGDGRCYAFEPVGEADPDAVQTLRCLWATDCNHPDYRRADFELAARPTRQPGPSEIVATPVCHEGRVYVSVGRDPAHPVGKGCLVCLDAATGRRLWAYGAIGPCLATAAVADGLVYVGEVRRTFHCVDAADGKPVWTHAIRGEIWGSALVADGKVYVPTTRGLLVFAAGREKRVLATVKLDAPLYATPCAAGDVLYVASARHLYAVEAGREGPDAAPGPPTPGDANLTMVLRGARGAGRDLVLHVMTRGGHVVHGFAEEADAAAETLALDLADVTVDGDALGGTVRMAPGADASDEEAGDADAPGLAAEMTLDVRACGTMASGTWAGPVEGTRATGAVEGTLGPPARAPQPGRVRLDLVGTAGGPDAGTEHWAVALTLHDGGIRGATVSRDGEPLDATVRGGVTVYEDRFAARIRVRPNLADEKAAKAGEVRLEAEGVCVGERCGGAFEAKRGKKEPVTRGRFGGTLVAADEVEDTAPAATH